MLVAQILSTLFVVWAVVDYLCRQWSIYFQEKDWDAYAVEPIWKTAGALIFAAVVLNGVWAWVLL